MSSAWALRSSPCVFTSSVSATLSEDFSGIELTPGLSLSSWIPNSVSSYLGTLLIMVFIAAMLLDNYSSELALEEIKAKEDKNK